MRKRATEIGLIYELRCANMNLAQKIILVTCFDTVSGSYEGRWLNLPEGSSRLSGSRGTKTRERSALVFIAKSTAQLPPVRARQDTEERAAMAKSTARVPPVNAAVEISKCVVRSISRHESSRRTTFFSHFVSSLEEPVAVRVFRTSTIILILIVRFTLSTGLACG